MAEKTQSTLGPLLTGTKGSTGAPVVGSHRCWSWTLGSKDRDIHQFKAEDYVEHLRQVGFIRVVIGREFGSTGYKHWQCCIEFKEPQEFPTQIFMWQEFVAGKLKWHDSRTKKFWNAFGYCRKGGDYVLVNDNNDAVEKKSAGDVALEVNTMIRSGLSLKEIDDVHPVYVMNNLDKLMRYQAWREGTYKRCRFDFEI